MYTVRIEAVFAAAHFLANYRGKCENMHGHNYRVRLYAAGTILDNSGMLLDFGVLKSALREVTDALDHRLLNEIQDFQNSPSAERIAEYIFGKVKAALPDATIQAVEVFESDTAMARYEP